MRLLSLLLLLALVAPLAHAQKADDKPDGDDIAGTWDYVVRPDNPFAQGTFDLVWQEGELRGTIQTDAERTFDTVALDGDYLTVTFEQPGMGYITVEGTFSEGTFEGETEIGGQAKLPFVATRQTSEAIEPDEGAEAMADAADTDGDVEHVLGTWNYTVSMSQQTFEGTFTILATTDGYAGEFVTDAPRPMTMLEVDGASTTFEFEHPSMGKINVTGQVDESDVFAGTVTLGPNTAPIMATREAAVADAMAASAEAVEEVEHVLGTWAYKVTPPGDDPVEGTFTLEMGPDGLTGTFQTNAARTMRFIEVEGTRLAFEFDQPGMGTVLIRGNIRGDNFEGEARPETAMGAAPMTATRLPAEDTTNN